MGFFSGLNAEKYDRQYSDRVLVRRMIAYFKPQKWRLIVVGILVLLMSGLGAVQPIAVSRGVERVGVAADLKTILSIAGFILIIGVSNWFTNWLRRRTTVRAIADVVLKIATDAFNASVNHDLSFFDELASGRVVSRITSDTREFGQLIVLVTDLIAQVFEAVLLGIVLVRTEWRLSLVIFAIVPIVFLLAVSYRHLARKVTQQGMRAMANVNSTIKETISGIAIAKNFRQEGSVYDEFDEANKLSYRVNIKRGLTLALVFPTLNIIGGLTTAALIYWGGLSAVEGLVTAGSWYLFLLSLDRFLYPIMSLSSFWTQVQSGLSAAERVFALIDAEPAVVQVGKQVVSTLVGRIEFKNVSFKYKTGEPILTNLNICVRPGEKLALVGHTGAGKTSIARLLARFYEFQEGAILIDGQDIRSFDLEKYRQHLGIVSQVPFLFSGTVSENIRYGRYEVSDEEIEVIAGQIGSGEWLDTLPQGLYTEVGERGVRLSMGQRQLVALMRVLVQKPEIFILDEATASIDPFTEWQIQQTLNLIMSKTTSVLIAHRLSTVKNADRIIVMEKGNIIDSGNHEQLLARGGHYAVLYKKYFRHQSLAYVEEFRNLVIGSEKKNLGKV
jgi:ATP-binding cassette subfamily B protein